MESGLYGIKHSNRDEKKHYGKNCFNSSFPTAMACYMMDKNIPAVYVKLVKATDGSMHTLAEEISIRDVFRCGDRSPEDLYFSFETVYEPYQEYSFDVIDGIDLVVKDSEGSFLAPLEVKLTVMPDSTTYKKPEDEWGSEIVIRSATTMYCALGMFDSVRDDARHIRSIFEDACASIQMWDNNYEMAHKTRRLCECINTFKREYYKNQKPLVIQPIWRTKGKSPFLMDDAFDLFIWSDYAFSSMFVDDSFEQEEEMSRPMRASARLARCLWELSKSGRIRTTDIYRQMTYDNQSDKEFSRSGTLWRRYVNTPRISHPILPKEAVHEIIMPGYIDRLSPERRFDQTLYFTMNSR